MKAKEKNKEKRVNSLILTLTVGMIAIAVFSVSYVVYQVVQPEEFQPLTYETVKIATVTANGTVVIPQVNGLAAPSIAASDREIPFFMSRCNSYPERFDSRAFTTFVLITDDPEVTEPVEFPFSKDGTVFTATTGCSSIRFVLEMPRDMLAYIDVNGDQASGGVTEWRVVGRSKALDIPGAVFSSWETESFFVFDDDPTLESDT